MSEKSLPQFASVEQPFGINPPIVYCPICGQASMEFPPEGSEDECAHCTPCEHLAFIFVGEVGEFEYQSEDFKKRLGIVDDEEADVEDENEDDEEDDEDDEDFQAMLVRAGYDNKLLALEITYGGMSCSGPSWYTDIFGFDYGMMKNEDEE